MTPGLFGPHNVVLYAPVKLHVSYDGCKIVGIREVYYSKKGTPEERITGFNVGGNSFGLDGTCKEAPWVHVEPIEK